MMTGGSPSRCAAYLVLAVFMALATAACDSGGPMSGDAVSARWTSLGIPFRTDVARAIAIDEACTFYMANYIGLYVSHDYGGTWERTLDVHYWDKWISVIAVHSPACLYVGTDGGIIHRSLDGGRTWEEVYRSPMYGDIVALFCDSRGRVFACDTRVELLVSTDQGGTWSTTRLRTYALDFAEDPNGDIFMAAHNAIYRLGEDDSTWVAVLDGLPAFTVRSMTIVPSGEFYLATGNGRILSFRPGDETLETVCVTPNEKEFYEIRSDDAGNLYAVQYGRAVYRYLRESGEWLETDMETPLYHLCAGSDGTVLCGGNNLYLSEDFGARWRGIGRNQVPISAVAVDAAGRMYAGTSGAGIFRLNEGGAWANKYNSYYDGEMHVTTIFVCDAMTIYGGTTDEGIVRSFDGGDVWSATFMEGTRVYDFAVDADGRLYGAFDGYICHIDEYLRRWVPIIPDVDYGFVYALETDRRGSIIAGAERGVFLSEDVAAGWRRVGAAYIDEPVTALCTTGGGHCFCSTASGIFRSNSSYSRWWRLEGIPPADSTVSIIDIPGGSVVIGVYGEGLYVCSEDAFAAVPVTDDLPDLRINSCAADGMDALLIGTESGVYTLEDLEMIVLRFAY